MIQKGSCFANGSVACVAAFVLFITSPPTFSDSFDPTDPAGFPLVIGDADEDGDVDLADYALFQTCQGTVCDSPGCAAADRAALDGDGNAIIDAADLDSFTECLSGPDHAVPAACVDPSFICDFAAPETAGAYSAARNSIPRFTASDAGLFAINMAVTDSPAGQAALAVSPTSLNFGSAGTNLTFEVWNSGGGSLDYVITDGADWLSVAPTSGSSAGEHDTIVATVNRSGLPNGSYMSTITVTPSTGSARTVVVSMSVAPTGGTQPMTTASRTSGVAPLSVFFDAVDHPSEGWSTGVVQAVGGDYAAMHYVWDFADLGSGTWSNGRQNPGGSYPSRNQATGYVTGHVFETPGTYNVQLQVITPAGQTYSYAQQITVQAFSGTTYYVASSGNDANAGSQAFPFKTWAKGISMLTGGGQKRVLFRRGDVFTNGSSRRLPDCGLYAIGAYGTGANPIIRATAPCTALVLVARDVRIVEVDFDVLSGVAAECPAIVPGQRLLLLRSRISGYLVGLARCHARVDDVFVVDSTFVDNGSYAVYHDYGQRVAVLGCQFYELSAGQPLKAFLTRSVVAHTTFRGGTAGGTQVSLYGLRADHLPWGETEYSMLADNLFEQANAVGTLAELGPEDNATDGRVGSGIVERNVFRGGTGTTEGVSLAASGVTLRNNTFDASGGNQAFTAIAISQLGLEPAPAGNRIYNNTAYRGDSETLVFVDIAPESSDTVVQNNLASAPSASEVMIAGGGSGLVQSHNLLTNSPGFVNAGAGDFRLSSGSPAVDSRLAIPSVREDMQRVARPAGPAYDIGAFERVP